MMRAGSGGGGERDGYVLKGRYRVEVGSGWSLAREGRASGSVTNNTRDQNFKHNHCGPSQQKNKTNISTIMIACTS